uniref:Putative AvrBs3 family type III effector protein n=1 Tax=Ralstonia solanacearum CFBP2957 TaxID=859656 RepID=D8P6P4_RALSL
MVFVIDVFARRIAGWRASGTVHTDFVRDAREQAGRPAEPWLDQPVWSQHRKRTARSRMRADAVASMPANPHQDARTQFTPGRLPPEPGPMPAHISPASAGSSSHVASGSVLPDPGTPTGSDLAVLEAESFGAAALAFDFDRFLQMLEV